MPIPNDSCLVLSKSQRFYRYMISAPIHTPISQLEKLLFRLPIVLVSLSKLFFMNYYCIILLQAFGQFSGHDHTIFINECERNYDFIVSKYVT